MQDVISPEHRANLERLASYLESLPPDYGHFSMRAFCQRAGEASSYPYSDSMSAPQRWECGTTACAAGHGPAAGIPAMAGETWMEYTERAFGAILRYVNGEEKRAPKHDRFDALFSMYLIGNHWDAATRIRNYLAAH